MKKPTHNKRFVFHYLDESTYQKFAYGYSIGKKSGIRGISSWAAAMGVWQIVKESIGGQLIFYARRKFGIIVISGLTWVGGPFIPMITNATKIVNLTKKVHTLVAFGFECVEDSNNLMFLPLDLALFGQLIPVGKEGRFNLMN